MTRWNSFGNAIFFWMGEKANREAAAGGSGPGSS